MKGFDSVTGSGVSHRPASGSLWAVVPLKSPSTAKSRLAPALDAPSRQRLMFAMARHVIRTLVRSPGIAGVAVATANAEVAACAEHEGAAVILQEHDAGTAAACRNAVTQLSAVAESVLMVSGDIPLINAGAIAELVKIGQSGPVVAIAPDRHRSGTNALLCAPPAIIPPCFGSDSFQLHVNAASVRGVHVHIVESEALALDIDSLDDLEELQRCIVADPALLPVELRNALSRGEKVPAQ